MAVCKVCGKEISGDINGVCEECKAYGLEYSSCYNPDNFEYEEDEFDSITDNAYDVLVMTDDASRIVDDLNSNDEKNSDLYNDFKNSSIKYKKFRLDIYNDRRHRDDYKKLVDFYKDDIESGLYKIGLASELEDDAVIVDASRGVVIYE
jgi:hypothetical protein